MPTQSPERPVTERTTVLALAAIAGIAALARFATLGDQSFWYDEALTVGLVRHSFGDMLSAVHDADGNPPLYYAVAWVWTRVFGDSEAGLRSLSATAGVLTVPVAYAAARCVTGRLGGLAAAFLVAISPPLIWYSQESRAYALVVLLSALSFMFFLRALETRKRRWTVLGWALTSSLALATHYFALFVVLPEAAWLLIALRPRRTAVAGVSLVGLTGIALLPLASYQRDHASVSWIADVALRDRAASVLKIFATGTPTSGPAVVAVAFFAFVATISVALARGRPDERRGTSVALLIAGSALGLALLAAALGSDYVLDRNLLPVWVPLVTAAAVGLAACSRRWVVPGLLIAGLLTTVFVLYDLKLATSDDLARDDWRSVARRLGPATEPRLVVVAPGWEGKALRLYQSELEPAQASARVIEVDVVVFSRPGWGRDAPPQPPRGGA